MLVPDVNILVYAFRTDSAEHEVYRAWLNDALDADRIGLADTIVSGFMRIVTHPRIYADPTPAAAALSFVRQLVDAPRTGWLRSGTAAWDTFEELTAMDPAIRGNLVPDAYIAALCVANGGRLATRDRGFARFPGLRWFDPARG